MKPTTFTLFLFALAATAVSGFSMLSDEAPAGSAAPAEAAAPTKAKPKLEPGMTTEQILAAVGKPAEVKPVVTDVAKGESWIYRRVQKRTTRQTTTRMEDTPAMGVWTSPGANSGLTSVARPVQRLEYITVYQVTALLIMDGKLVTARQWLEQDRSFE